MTSPVTSSTQSMSSLDNVVDLGPGSDQVCAIVPVPNTAGRPSFTRYGQAAAHTWSVVNSEGHFIGYLCLYPSDSKDQAILLVYGKNAFGRPDWRSKYVPRLERAIHEFKLKERGPATIIIASRDQEVPSGALSKVEGDAVVVPATISFEGGTTQSSVKSLAATSSEPSSPKVAPQNLISASYLCAEGVRTKDHVELPEMATLADTEVQGAQLELARPTPGASAPVSRMNLPQPATEITMGMTPVPSQTDADGEASEISMIRAADLIPETLAYIWKGRIPCGKLTMVVGDPGLGKSLLAAHLAAIVSRGAAWVTGEDPALKGSVILVNTEDGLADTVRPRLEAAGADLNAVHLLSDLDLTRDFEALERRVSRIPEVKLIIIDPITSCFGRANLNGTAEVRAILNPLTRFAARTGIAVVFITHLNKRASGRALTRSTGSHAFVAVARSAFTLCKDPSDPGRRLLLPMKNNLGVADHGVAFRIEEIPIGAGTAPRIVFDSEPVIITADEALNGTSGNRSRQSAVDEAKELLLDCLTGGAVPFLDLQFAAKEAGITVASLRRAKDSLGVLSKKSGMTGKWQWMLPRDAKMINPAEGAQVEQMSTFAEDDHLRGDGEIGRTTTDAKGDRT